ncbi:Ig-like domain-containing protein [Paraglaciecola sp.]|uniref:Ig-like domain-containing protein n=1 Tax=Paraglaciecola sp. TaxID=1920173 RepID=UPI0030F3AAE5
MNKMTKTLIIPLIGLGINTSAFAAIDCNGLATWNSSTEYSGGTQVQHKNNAYKASWWNNNANPETHSGPWQEWKYIDACGDAGIPPTVTITSPTNNQEFLAGETVSIAATAADSDSAIENLQFYIDELKIGEDNSSPYSINWTAVTGNHTITVLATDDTGLTNDQTITIKVIGDNIPPSVTITSPASDEKIKVGDTVELKASATDSDGSINDVSFYLDDALVATDTTFPYSVNWTATIGAHSIKAKAQDNDSAVTYSAEITIMVDDKDSTGGCGDIADYKAGDSYSAGQFVAHNNHKYTCNVAGWCSSSAAWAYEPGVGNHWQTAWSDNGICSIAPEVVITSPADNSVVLAGSEVTISANASDGDGNITMVEFFANDISLAQDNSSPYQVTFTATNAGDNTLKATATDNDGNQTSTSVLLSVSEKAIIATLTSPTSGSSVAVGNSVNLTAEASAIGSTITSVDFRINGVSVSIDNQAPYQANWTPTAAGQYTITATAIDNTGANATSAAATITATDVVISSHKLIGYWHNFVNGSGCPIRLADISPQWDVIDIAFADNDRNSNGTVHFNLYAGDIHSFCAALDAVQFKADVASLRAQGKKVVLSLGGAEGNITLNNDADESNFVSSLTGIIQTWGFDGLDVDLESGSNLLHGTQIQNRLGRALLQIEQNIGGDMYLTMAPEHPYVQGGYIAYSGIWGAYIPVIDATRSTLDLLHVQLYNNGGLASPYSTGASPAGSVDMMVASARMLLEGFELANGQMFMPLRPDQVALGLPSGPQAAGSGQATNQAIFDALDCITKGTKCNSFDAGANYPSFSGVMTWSINWDKHDGFIFSNPVGDKVHSLP